MIIDDYARKGMWVRCYGLLELTVLICRIDFAARLLGLGLDAIMQ